VESVTRPVIPRQQLILRDTQFGAALQSWAILEDFPEDPFPEHNLNWALLTTMGQTAEL
jgi:hypothetical protein